MQVLAKILYGLVAFCMLHSELLSKGSPSASLSTADSEQRPLLVTDASGLSRAEIAAIYRIAPGTTDDVIAQLKVILDRAQSHGLKISVRGSQHTQGGHTFYPSGLVLDLSQCKQMRLVANAVLRVQAGATWKEILEFLNPLGLSVSIMQSDYDFSIGGTLSANVHGWQMHKPPLVHSIRGFHLMLANGEVVYCSRDSHPELFKSAIGGFGLLGVILDVDLEVVPNLKYSFKKWVKATADFPSLFKQAILSNPKTQLFFGRFNLDYENFLEKLIVSTYEEPHPTTLGHLQSPASLTRDSTLSTITRLLFKHTQGNAFWKKVRWGIEAQACFPHGGEPVARNQLFYYSVHDYLTEDPTQTDLIQEYFIPVEAFSEWVEYLQSIKESLLPHLMNLTLRYVRKDTETLLNYATNDSLCFVMLFRGPQHATFDNALKVIAQHMIDKALELNGTYYLPYRPYARLDQFHKAYPRYQQWIKLKQQYDPKVLFMNHFYTDYFKKL